MRLEAKTLMKMCLLLDSGKYLFVRECKGKIAYYIFSSDRKDIGLGQRRDIDTLSKLWEDNLQDPANVIRKTAETFFGLSTSTVLGRKAGYHGRAVQGS